MVHCNMIAPINKKKTLNNLIVVLDGLWHNLTWCLIQDIVTDHNYLIITTCIYHGNWYIYIFINTSENFNAIVLDFDFWADNF